MELQSATLPQNKISEYLSIRESKHIFLKMGAAVFTTRGHANLF